MVAAYFIDKLLLEIGVQNGRKITVLQRTYHVDVYVHAVCRGVSQNSICTGMSCAVVQSELHEVGLFHLVGTNRASVNWHFGVFKDHKHAQKVAVSFVTSERVVW
jgi:hypothetical protein